MTSRLSPSRRDRPGRERLTTIALFLLPALVLYAVFVLFPIVQAMRFSLFKWNGLQPLTDFVGLANYQRALADPVFQGAVSHNVFVDRPVAGDPDPVRPRAGTAAQPPLPGPGVLRLHLLRAVRHRRGHHRCRLDVDPAAERTGRRAARPRSAWARSTSPGWPTRDTVMLAMFVDHLVEVLRLPHDPAAGRPAAASRVSSRRRPRSTARAAVRRSATSPCRCSGRRCGCRSSCRSSARCSCST